MWETSSMTERNCHVHCCETAVRVWGFESELWSWPDGKRLHCLHLTSVVRSSSSRVSCLSVIALQWGRMPTLPYTYEALLCWGSHCLQSSPGLAFCPRCWLSLSQPCTGASWFQSQRLLDTTSDGSPFVFILYFSSTEAYTKKCPWSHIPKICHLIVIIFPRDILYISGTIVLFYPPPPLIYPVCLSPVVYCSCLFLRQGHSV